MSISFSSGAGGGDSQRVLVVGARRRRQGIGEYVARSFHRAGCLVEAIVGTSPSSVEAALAQLRGRYGIQARGYVDLEEALERERPGVVAICSPYLFHRQALELVAQGGEAHCLCEKPLWWEEGVGDRLELTQRIIQKFLDNQKYLDTITQWPQTLPYYYQLFPRPKELRRFEMMMGPREISPELVLESFPHIFSMLYALVGVGEIAGVELSFSPPRWRELEVDVVISFSYRHSSGEVAVSCAFVRSPQPPRPAGYGINGRWAMRKIRLPQYQFYFESDGKVLDFPDPLDLHIQEFLTNLAQKLLDQTKLLNGMELLEKLYFQVEHLWAKG
ncbi:MAG: hypothetical protein D6805_07590 [Planctomycetota bacterium]|nr:MAG: hypothetical protein D6805_07590 [Planctomycetota bacterium]